MSASLTIERRIKELEIANGGIMPYQLMLRKMQEKLDREKNPDKRFQLEIQVVMLLGIIDMQKGITKMVQALNKQVEGE